MKHLFPLNKSPKKNGTFKLSNAAIDARSRHSKNERDYHEIRASFDTSEKTKPLLT